MITVAHLDHSAEPGGAELALARLIEDHPGWDPRVFVPPSSGSRTGAFDRVPSHLVFRVGVGQPAGAIRGGLKEQITLFARVFLQAAALRINRKFRNVQVVHANTSRAAIIGWLACIGSQRRLVVHLRDAIDAEALGRRNAELLKMIVSRAGGVIANSEYTLNTAVPHMQPGTPRGVIPSPTGLTEHRPVVPVRPQVEVIGMLARITEWKGQELLIRAFADVFRGSSVKLELAGSPAFGQDEYLLHLRRTVHQLDIDDQVVFLGHVADIWSLVDSWDICVHASLHSEPLGQNVLQYLAACRPTVAAEAGGPAEWIQPGQTGLLFEMGSQESLALALRKVAGDAKLRAALSEALVDKRPVPVDAEVRQLHANFFEGVWNRQG